MKKLLLAVAIGLALTNGMQGQQLSAPAGGIVSPDAILSAPEVDVRAYGAKCDGTTNDLVAFQRAIGAAIAEKAALRVPQGNCRLNFEQSNSVINITGDLTITGAGQGQSSLTVGPSTPSFSYQTFNVAPGTNFTVQDLTVNGPTYAVVSLNVSPAYFIWQNGGPGKGSITLRDDNITGQFYSVIAKNGPPDTGTSDNVINIFNTQMTCYYMCNSIFTSPGTLISDAIVTGTNLNSQLTMFSQADVGSRVALSGGGPNGAPLATTIASYVDAHNVTLATAVSTNLVKGRTVYDASMQASRSVNDGAITAGTNTLTTGTSIFVPADVGRVVTVTGAGAAGKTYSSTIIAYTSATSVQVRVNAVTTVTGATVTITPDTLLTSATAAFTAGDVGRVVTVYGAGAGGSNLLSLIKSYVNSSSVYLQNAASTTVTNAQADIAYAPVDYNVPALSLNVTNSRFTNIAYNSGGEYGYFFYIHPSVSVLMDGDYFDNAPYYAIHLWSSGGIPPYELASSVRINNSYFGPNLAGQTGGAIAATEANTFYHPVISNCTIRSHQGGVYVSGASVELDNDDINVPGAPINVVYASTYMPARITVNGGRISGSGVGVGLAGSTWVFDGVNFETNGANYAITNTQAQYLKLIVQNSQFHGSADGVIDSRTGDNIIQNNLFAMRAASGSISLTTTGVISADVSGNIFAQPGNAVAIQTNSLGPQVLRGSGNRFLTAAGPYDLGNDVEALGNRSGVYPTVTPSASSLTLGNPNQAGLTAWNFDTFHVSGTAQINNIYLDSQSRTGLFDGTIHLIADGAWSLGTSGNIRPKTTLARTVNEVVTLAYDPRTGAWFELGGSGMGNAQAKSVATPINAVSFSATPVFDASLSNAQKITLTGDVSSSTLVNATAGEQVTFLVCQDATGGHSFAWPANVKGSTTVGTSGGSCTSQTFLYDGTNAYATGSATTSQ